MIKSDSRTILRRIIILVGVLVGFVIVAYGWTVTQINLDRPQEPVRQQNVTNALRELLSPNVFTQDYAINSTTTSILVDCPADGGTPETPAAPDDGSSYIVVTPACASEGDIITVTGYNFYPDTLARLNWIGTDGERRIRQVIGSEDNNFVVGSNGTFTAEIEVPRIRGSSGETHTIEVQDATPSGPVRFSDTTALVMEKMVETIFLALIATLISILPSAVLSFFAAHNLMRPVKMSLGSLLIAFALLPVGWWLGSLLLGAVGNFAISLGSGQLFAGSASTLIIAFGAVAVARRQAIQPETLWFRVRGVLMSLLFAVITIAVLGLLGGVGILIGTLWHEGILGYISAFVGSLGELVQLLIPTLSGITGAFVLGSAGITLTRPLLKAIDVPVEHILGAVLGVICGGILLAFSATVGMQAAWLGLLTPVIAAAMGGAVLPGIYNRLLPSHPAKGTFKTILRLIGAAALFVITFMALRVERAVVEGVLPPTTVAFTIGNLVVYEYVAKAMLIGAVVGGISAGVAGTRAQFPVGEVLYNTTRTILNALRAIEPLIMGLVFVIWVGIGPFAGVLALTLHSIASLGKLYSEQIENIDNGPLEALQSTGANRLQTIMYAVVPQVIPPYIAFTMYRWDINVRMSTIIGFVGGGGVGFLLQQQINLLRYREAGVAVLAIAIVVSILDYASASIRERVT